MSAERFLSEEASPPTRTNGAGATCLRRSACGYAREQTPVLLRANTTAAKKGEAVSERLEGAEVLDAFELAG